MERESFVFYKSFYEGLKELPDNIRLEVYDAVCSYAITGEMPELTGFSKSAFLLIKPQIDANNARFERGSKGGRKGKKPMVSENDENEKPMVSENKKNKKPMVSKNDENEKPMVSKNAENKKPNVNVNDNVNVNVNENVKDKRNYAQSDSEIAPEPVADVAAIPLNDSSEWKPPESLFNEMVKLYPNVNVVQEFNNMRGWCLSNPSKRKTKSGVKKFVNSWLAREQDKGHQSPMRASPPQNNGYEYDLSKFEYKGD